MQTTIQQVKDLGERVEGITKRIEALEKDSAFMTDASEDHSELLISETQKANEHIQQIKDNINSMQSKLKNIRIELDMLIGKLRDSVRKTDLERVKERVEEWAPEKYATKLDLREYEDQ